jgi:hypothetical protein
MKKTSFLQILEELCIGLSIAIAIGADLNSPHLIFADLIPSLLSVLAASLFLIPVGLIVVWLSEFLLIRVSQFLGGDYNRSQARGLLRIYYIALILLIMPVFSYAVPGIPIFLLSTIYIWRKRLSHDSLTEGLKRRFAQLQNFVVNFGVVSFSWTLAGILGLFYIVISVGLFAEIPQPEGDEPHYLTTAYSLVVDGDFELFHNYERREYELWHTGWIQSHTKAGKEGIHQQYPMHNTGLAMLLSPAMSLALVFKTTWAVHFFTRLTMILLMVIFLALLFQVLFRLLNSAIISAGLVLLAGLTVPLLFFSYHIFTEVPVAILSLFVFAQIIREDSPKVVSRILVGLALAFMPFLSVKYIFVAASLSFIWLFREFTWGFSTKKLSYIIIPGLIVIGLYFWQTWSFFGTISPSAYYLGGSTSMFGQTYLFKVSHASSLIDQLAITGETALSFFVGQREALLFYSPWYLLSIAGLVIMWRRPELRRMAISFLVILLPFLVLYGATGFGGGHAPPARAITAIIWVFIIPIGLFFKHRQQKSGEISFGLFSFSLLIALVLILNPGFLYHDFPIPSGHIATSVSSPASPVYTWIPSVNNKHFENWLVTALWSIVYIAIPLLLLRKTGANANTGRFNWCGCSTMIFIIAVIGWALLGGMPSLERESVVDNERNISLAFEGDNQYVDPQGFWIKSNSTSVAYLVSREELTEAIVRFRTLAPNKAVIEHKSYVHVVDLVDRNLQKLSLPLGNPIHRGGLWIYRLTITSESGKPAGADAQVNDVRPLGLEVLVLDLN